MDNVIIWFVYIHTKENLRNKIMRKKKNSINFWFLRELVNGEGCFFYIFVAGDDNHAEKHDEWWWAFTYARKLYFTHTHHVISHFIMYLWCSWNIQRHVRDGGDLELLLFRHKAVLTLTMNVNYKFLIIIIINENISYART